MRNFKRYLTLGIGSTIFTIALYYFVSDLIGVPAFLVTILYTPIGFIFRYFINKKWVFNR